MNHTTSIQKINLYLNEILKETPRRKNLINDNVVLINPIMNSTFMLILFINYH